MAVLQEVKSYSFEKLRILVRFPLQN